MATEVARSKLNAFKSSLSTEDLAIHRQSFIHFSKNLAATAAEVMALSNDGKRVKGTFNTMTPFPDTDFKVCIKAARSVNEDLREIEDPALAPGCTVVIKGKDWASIKVVSNMEMKADAAQELRTDASISRKDLAHLQNRELQSVSSSWLDESTNTSIHGGKIGNWNQFEANKNISGYREMGFDENLYTKKLDKSSLSAAKQREAELLAHQIESNVSGNVHLQEERGQKPEGGEGGDEEALSAVMGTGGFKGKQDGGGGAWRRGVSMGSKGGVKPPVSDNEPGLPKRDKNAPWGASTAGLGGAPPGLSTVRSISTAEKPNADVKPLKEDGKPAEDEDKPAEDKDKPKLKATASSFVPRASAKEFTPTLTPPAPPPMQNVQPSMMAGANGHPVQMMNFGAQPQMIFGQQPMPGMQPQMIAPDGQMVQPQIIMGMEGQHMMGGYLPGMVNNYGQPMDGMAAQGHPHPGYMGGYGQGGGGGGYYDGGGRGGGYYGGRGGGRGGRGGRGGDRGGQRDRSGSHSSQGGNEE